MRRPAPPFSQRFAILQPALHPRQACRNRNSTISLKRLRMIRSERVIVKPSGRAILRERPPPTGPLPHSMQRTSQALAASLLAILAGCAAQQTEQREAPEPEITVRGSLAFRQGVAPPSGSIVTVSVADFADDSAAPVATLSIRIENSRALLPFELRAPMSKFAPEPQYVVRASVTSPQNAARWTTDVAQIIDTTLEEVDVGVLLITPSRDSDPD